MPLSKVSESIAARWAKLAGSRRRCSFTVARLLVHDLIVSEQERLDLGHTHRHPLLQEVPGIWSVFGCRRAKIKRYLFGSLPAVIYLHPFIYSFIFIVCLRYLPRWMELRTSCHALQWSICSCFSVTQRIRRWRSRQRAPGLQLEVELRERAQRPKLDAGRFHLHRRRPFKGRKLMNRTMKWR